MLNKIKFTNKCGHETLLKCSGFTLKQINIRPVDSILDFLLVAVLIENWATI